MKSYIDNLERLGHPLSLGLGVSLILISLRKEFDGFVQNYNMYSMWKTINELHAMLKLHEQTFTLPKNKVPSLYVIRAGKYLAELLKKKKKTASGASGSGIFTIELNTFLNRSWIYDTGCGNGQREAIEAICVFHLSLPGGLVSRNNMVYFSAILRDGIFKIDLSNSCINESSIYAVSNKRAMLNLVQGLRGSRKLKPGALSLYVDNGQRATVEAIRTYHLCLPSRLVIILNNCHYAPSITRGIISVSKLYDDGYVNCFVDNTIQVSRNNMVYFSIVPRGGIFEINLSNYNTNNSSIYAVSNKRAMLNLDSALLWHCCLGHISKKRIEKKMARKPYTHQVERAEDLLGLIHTDVCGPFKIMSRHGINYFITFTDDFSRYGYVYLLKHKHEVFETFKVFQKEVENQLGKTIKSLRSDHEGEYMSQDFLDHLKDHGIIAYRTPPYTPQHNGMSEKRNRTILDMVRSMMSQTTLPKSFWVYALETAARGFEELVKRDTLTKLDKLESRSIKCIFIGYPKETMGYSFYYPPENEVLIAWNAEFLNNSLITQEAKDDLEIDEPQSDVVPIHWSIRTQHSPDRMCLYIDVEEHELGDLDNEVWDLVELPPNGKTVGSKWLFKNKTDMDGAVHTYKARLVAKGYTQPPRINYEETFSPLVDIRAIRSFIAITVFYDYEIGQMDVKTAFLNGYLSKEVYMEQPEASGSNVTSLILYVDDILIMGNNIPMLQDVKSYLGRCFAMKDLGEAAYILGIKIYKDRSRRLIGLCQSAYIEKILKRYHMENFKRGNIPMQEKLRLSKSQGASTPPELKRMCLHNGLCFMYIMKYPQEYLKSLFLSLLKGDLINKCSGVGDLKRELWVFCYTDVGYLTDADDLKSQTGYVFVFNGGSPIAIANESGITKGARHFRAKVHYLREVIEFGDIKLEKVHTDDNLADPFTKALAFPKHSELTRNIGMLPASSFM
ncbi:retrotransposon protein, putative, ty1-copia subclass [Tanacetum coccineum]